jgi:hypothetical protein
MRGILNHRIVWNYLAGTFALSVITLAAAFKYFMGLLGYVVLLW